MFYLVAVVTLVCVLAFNLFLSAPLQTAFGVWGIAATELGYGVLALAGGCVMILLAQRKKVDGIDCIEIFSTRVPPIKACFGGLLLMGAAYLASSFYTNILYALFPEALNETVDSLKSVMYADNLPVMIVIMAVFPAVCEELVFRGLTQYTFERFSTPRIAIFLTGIIFGLFHIDPVRIPITICLGIALSYACWRSRSIFVPMLMHFCNNAFSALVTVLPTAQTESTGEELNELLQAAGLSEKLPYVIGAAELFFMALGLLIGGFALLEEHPTKALREHKVTAVVLLTILLLLTVGYLVTIFSIPV